MTNKRSITPPGSSSSASESTLSLATVVTSSTESGSSLSYVKQSLQPNDASSTFSQEESAWDKASIFSASSRQHILTQPHLTSRPHAPSGMVAAQASSLARTGTQPLAYDEDVAAFLRRHGAGGAMSYEGANFKFKPANAQEKKGAKEKHGRGRR
ncbi:hypothetical protein CBOM_01737 [Ceraceosorus bombacis]|uniref:Uncharacterized protein n=1 Tax=Ceraceosorus bombacis TaxID=401625 RepID=A0A0P1BCM2_9BASI|nr:hypothetical protein CBOM_01737 [Ceraceosorus bombacis]